MSEFSTWDWGNGQKCPNHANIYCVACFHALMEKKNAASYLRIPNVLKQRISQRNFADDSRHAQFALSCQLGEEGHIVIPLKFALFSDVPEEHCWQATDEELRDVLKAEHAWDVSTPAWAQNFTPAEYSLEDQILLKELQLFL